MSRPDRRRAHRLEPAALDVRWNDVGDLWVCGKEGEGPIVAVHFFDLLSDAPPARKLAFLARLLKDAAR